MARPNPKIYGEVQAMVSITVDGEAFEVPEDIPVIRALQYIQFELGRMTSDWSRFCFNDTIGCCAFEYAEPGESEAKPGRACCVRVAAGLSVHVLPQGSVMVDPEED